MLRWAAVALCAAAALAAGSRPKAIVTILIDDLGSYDTAVNNPALVNITPELYSLSHQHGMRLSRFYTFKYCSPTRRAMLSGRFPVHVSGMQAQPCDNTLPVELTLLSQKLKQAPSPWACHFVGKGHLGYPTTDHLPINRGFDSHVGYLAGAEDYDHGFNYGPSHDCGGTPKSCVHDFWHDHKPGDDLVDQIYYSTNYYTERAQQLVLAHAANHTGSPLWLHLTYQGVHSPYVSPPAWEQISPEQDKAIWDHTFGSMLAVVDRGIANLTATIKQAGLWEDTLLIITSDNGGIGPGNNYPLRGCKATPWEGGVRVMGFMTGGFLPRSLVGTSYDQAISVADWYPTICGLAGVPDCTDNVDIQGRVRGIDGIDVWPSITAAASQVGPQYNHEYLPLTPEAIIYQDRWKLITNAQPTWWYDPATSQHLNDNRTGWPCRNSDNPTHCNICTGQSPCLFDVQNDPGERTDLSSQRPELVQQLKTKMAEYQPYIPNPAWDPIKNATIRAKYECVTDIRPWWGNFSGPCCKPKSVP